MPLYPGHGLEGRWHSVEGHIFEPLSTACNTKRILSYKDMLLYARQHPGHLCQKYAIILPIIR